MRQLQSSTSPKPEAILWEDKRTRSCASPDLRLCRSSPSAAVPKKEPAAAENQKGKMIKRRFYKVEHGDRNDVSDSSSSSSDSDADSIQKEEEEEEEEMEETIAAEKPTSPSSGSGYECEDSSGNELDCNSPGQLLNEHNEGTGKDAQPFKDRLLTGKGHVEPAAERVSDDVPKALNSRDSTEAEFGDFVLKCKSVFKCRICPRIVCLSEDTLRAHLNSKRHSRSKKLLDEGRLKVRLNSDGEIEEEQETHAERHARIVALAQDSTSEKKKKKNKGRQRQRQRLKKRLQNASKEGKASESMMKPAKKRRKT